MTVDEAIQQLQKISDGRKGHFKLLALDDQKYSIVTPVKEFIECRYDKENNSIDNPEDLDEKVICDSLYVNSSSVYDRF